MPELPEVETVKSVIEPRVAGRTIERVAVRRPEVIAHPDAEAFCRRLAGQVFAGMARRGKFLVFHLASGGHVLLHLRMTGCRSQRQEIAGRKAYPRCLFPGGRQRIAVFRYAPLRAVLAHGKRRGGYIQRGGQPWGWSRLTAA